MIIVVRPFCHVLFLWLIACLQLLSGSFRILKHAPAAALMSHKCNSSANISLCPGWLENFWHVSFVLIPSQFVFASRSTPRTKEISSPSPQKERLLTSSSLTRSSTWLWWTSSAESSHCPSEVGNACSNFKALRFRVSEHLYSSRCGLLCQTNEPVLMKGKLYLFLFTLQVSDYWACAPVLIHINCLSLGFPRWGSSRMIHLW